MINRNGQIIEEAKASISLKNRGFNYGDALFETFKVVSGNILFLEDHYFRLMASMRILRMEIPMEFTMEFIEDEIKALLKANNLDQSVARVKLVVNRKSGGFYTPESNEVEYIILAEALSNAIYSNTKRNYTIEIFKDYPVVPGLLSTLKSNNKIVNVLGSIFAKENGFDNCIIINTNKMVVEVLNANVFMVKGNTILTPPLSDGCLKGIMRKQLIDLINDDDDYILEESSISPFDLLKADELFLTNVIIGIQSVTNYRKKRYSNAVGMKLTSKLNEKVRLLFS